MKICCFGDLHYSGSRKWLSGFIESSVASVCNGEDVDVAVVVGDVTGYGDLEHLREVLELLRRELEAPYIMVVPGNHDIYVTDEEVSRGINSLLKLSMFNGLAEKLGCIALMKRPFILGSTAFVGSIAWYDYSFAPDYLGLTIEDFRAKAFGLYTWADRDYVRLPFSDEEFTLYLLEKFEEDIKKVYGSVEKIVAVLHHVPFRKLVRYRLEPSWDYFSTFMGSESFGYVIKKYSDKVRLVVYGHQHDGVVTRTCKNAGSIKACNCASPIPLVLEV